MAVCRQLSANVGADCAEGQGKVVQAAVGLINQLSQLIPSLLLAPKQSAPVRARKATDLSPALWHRACCAGSLQSVSNVCAACSLHGQVTPVLPAASPVMFPLTCLLPPLTGGP